MIAIINSSVFVKTLALHGSKKHAVGVAVLIHLKAVTFKAATMSHRQILYVFGYWNAKRDTGICGQPPPFPISLSLNTDILQR
jgi:hypothetical protein